MILKSQNAQKATLNDSRFDDEPFLFDIVAVADDSFSKAMVVKTVARGSEVVLKIGLFGLFVCQTGDFDTCSPN